jgi:group I intron endonuclease
MTIWAVYIITNKANGKQYVGIAKNLKRRWHQHISANGSAPALHAAIKMYGADGFVFSHICNAFDFEAACDIERMFIQQHNTKSPNGYNLTDGGEGVVGRPMTDEDKDVRRKASNAFINSLSPEERSKKYGVKGRKLTSEQIEKIKVSNKGKNLGKKHSEETLQKMSAAHKARPRKPMSEDTKEKIRQSLLGRKMPESEKQKHASFLGCKHTEETKAKIRASNIATKALNKAKRLAKERVENDQL